MGLTTLYLALIVDPAAVAKTVWQAQKMHSRSLTFDLVPNTVLRSGTGSVVVQKWIIKPDVTATVNDAQCLLEWHSNKPASFSQLEVTATDNKTLASTSVPCSSDASVVSRKLQAWNVSSVSQSPISNHC